VCRSLWAGSTRVNLERVCDSLDGPMRGVIREGSGRENMDTLMSATKGVEVRRLARHATIV
jgi:hypothetical protein